MQVSYKTFTDRASMTSALIAFEQRIEAKAEVIGYQVPVIMSNGVVDMSKSPDAGGLGDPQKDRRDLLAYFEDEGWEPQPMQVELRRLSDGIIFPFQGFESIPEFIGEVRTVAPPLPDPVPDGFSVSAARELILLPVPANVDPSPGTENVYFSAVNMWTRQAKLEASKGAFVNLPDIAEQVTINQSGITYYPLLYISAAPSTKTNPPLTAS